MEGTSLSVLGTVNVMAKFVDKDFPASFIILAEDNIKIIGLKDMERNSVVIDTAKHQIRIGESTQHFTPSKILISNVKETTPNLFLASDELLPPRSHKIVTGFVKGPLPETKDSLNMRFYLTSR